MADQRNQNQGSQDQTNRNPQGKTSQQSTSSSENLRERDRENREREGRNREEDKKKGSSDLDRKGPLGTRNEELETPEGRAGSKLRDDEDNDELSDRDNRRERL